MSESKPRCVGCDGTVRTEHCFEFEAPDAECKRCAYCDTPNPKACEHRYIRAVPTVEGKVEARCADCGSTDVGVKVTGGFRALTITSPTGERLPIVPEAALPAGTMRLIGPNVRHVCRGYDTDTKSILRELHDMAAKAITVTSIEVSPQDFRALSDEAAGMVPMSERKVVKAASVNVAAAATDDELRAECNRRWGEDDCPMAKTLRYERDDWRRLAEAAESAANEWRARALAAEEKLANPAMVAPASMKPSDADIAAINKNYRGVRFVVDHVLRDGNEMGPGIKALPEKRPDNSLYVLDEDCLCADED